MTDILKCAEKRYTTKAYNPNKRIPAETLHRLLETLRLTASSVNSQPWHFIVAGTKEGKERLLAGFGQGYEFNAPKITNASEVVVLCTRNDMSAEFLQTLLDQEDKDGRFANDEIKAGNQKGREFFVNIHKKDRNDLKAWLEKQTYIAVGTLLLAAAAEGVDATPIEGFDATALDKELKLAERGLSSTVVIALGYHSDEDFNAKLPKSRLPASTVIEKI